jgi:heme/copper-type cytochrome/quinol oxidase subunit 2
MTIRASRFGSIALFLVPVVFGGGLGLASSRRPPPSQKREITIRARKYAYKPETIRVNKGDVVHIRLISDDVTHGFYLEGYDIDAEVQPLTSKVTLRRPSRPGESQEVDEIVFTANHEGKFRYRCSHTCGYLHAFMLGEMIVAPNRLLPASQGMAVGVLLGAILISFRKGGTP